MALPSISDIARLTADPDLRNVSSGKAVCKARLAFNESKYNRDTRQWENGATLFVDAELWEDQAERFADQLHQGDEVHVVGELKTDTWEANGEKKSKTVLRVRRFKAIPKAGNRDTGGGNGYTGNWNTNQEPRPATGFGTTPAGGYDAHDEEPPF